MFDLAAAMPYPPEQGSLEELSPEDVVALCIYRGGPQATVETYVRGKSVYRRPGLS
jgi:guanine deaminase